MNLDFDGFVEVAVRLIADDLEATAVLRALDDGAAHQHDEFSVAARRLRLAQYAGMWSAPRRAAPVLEIDPR